MKNIFAVIILSGLFSSSSFSGSKQLIEKICGDFDGPILYSQIKHKSNSEGISLDQAFMAIVQERSYKILLKKEVGIDDDRMDKIVTDKINDIRKANNLSLEDFKKALSLPPYNTTYENYKEQMLLTMAKSHLLSIMEKKIGISEQDKKSLFDDYVRKNITERKIVTIAVSNGNYKTLLKIKEQIKNNYSLSSIISSYSSDAKVAIEKPVSIKPALLERIYGAKILQGGDESYVIEIEGENGDKSLIWRLALDKDRPKVDLPADVGDKILMDEKISRALESLKNIATNLLVEKMVINDCKEGIIKNN